MDMVYDDSSGYYISTPRIPPDTCDSVTYYYVKLWDRQGHTDSSSTRSSHLKYKVALKPNLYIGPPDIFITGTNELHIGARIHNAKFHSITTRSVPMPAESV